MCMEKGEGYGSALISLYNAPGEQPKSGSAGTRSHRRRAAVYGNVDWLGDASSVSPIHQISQRRSDTGKCESKAATARAQPLPRKTRRGGERDGVRERQGRRFPFSLLRFSPSMRPFSKPLTGALREGAISGDGHFLTRPGGVLRFPGSIRYKPSHAISTNY